ncbi:hypothetical protein RRG08_031475 [Elysia crispata]|uniref:Uncharacterized protein n=1 Tax=Elysia crispata TaxID=231223 RepID=A0AAE1DJ22_9GAST|nr:hypothetical protein RRG08_031475 [Elysia crispata]
MLDTQLEAHPSTAALWICSAPSGCVEATPAPNRYIYRVLCQGRNQVDSQDTCGFYTAHTGDTVDVLRCKRVIVLSEAFLDVHTDMRGKKSERSSPVCTIRIDLVSREKWWRSTDTVQTKQSKEVQRSRVRVFLVACGCV